MTRPRASWLILRRTNALREQNGFLALCFGRRPVAPGVGTQPVYMAEHGIAHEGPVGVTAKQRILNAGYGGRLI